MIKIFIFSAADTFCKQVDYESASAGDYVRLSPHMLDALTPIEGSS